jgi:hypothetical protein
MTGQRESRHLCRRPAVLLSAVTLAVAMAAVPAAGAAASGSVQPLTGGVSAHSATQPPQGPFVTLLFSRTEISAADNCVEDDNSIARLDTTVAPYLQSLGMAGTGTLVTDRTGATTRKCTHYNDDLTASWADATNLAQNYGWSFVSHTATYPTPKKLQSLTPAQAEAETCGSEATIKAHGLPGAAGMIAYPGDSTRSPAVVNLQTKYGQTCFDWGRQYDHAVRGINNLATASTTPPYWAYTFVPAGGHCNDPTQPCYTKDPYSQYTMPSTVIKQIQGLKPGQWYILQVYLLVTGTNPKYTSNNLRWDCTSPNPAEHWTNGVVRYCWSDYQQIIQAIAADPSITVSDPLTIGKAWGRPYS